MSLVWRDQLSVGNNVIDSDHKHLIEIILDPAIERVRVRNLSRAGLGATSLKWGKQAFRR